MWRKSTVGKNILCNHSIWWQWVLLCTAWGKKSQIFQNRTISQVEIWRSVKWGGIVHKEWATWGNSGFLIPDSNNLQFPSPPPMKNTLQRIQDFHCSNYRGYQSVELKKKKKNTICIEMTFIQQRKKWHFYKASYSYVKTKYDFMFPNVLKILFKVLWFSSHKSCTYQVYFQFWGLWFWVGSSLSLIING